MRLRPAVTRPGCARANLLDHGRSIGVSGDTARSCWRDDLLEMRVGPRTSDSDSNPACPGLRQTARGAVPFERDQVIGRRQRGARAGRADRRPTLRRPHAPGQVKTRARRDEGSRRKRLRSDPLAPPRRSEGSSDSQMHLPASPRALRGAPVISLRWRPRPTDRERCRGPTRRRFRRGARAFAA